METNQITSRALRLYEYILRRNYDGHKLIGPDPGLRFNARVWRFLKSGLRFLPWSDSRVFMQAQGYWIWCNWNLYATMKGEKYRTTALKTTSFVLSRQNAEGYWKGELEADDTAGLRTRSGCDSHGRRIAAASDPPRPNPRHRDRSPARRVR